MDKQSFRNASREEKIDLLNKLKSGEFRLLEADPAIVRLDFILQSDYTYKCVQDGRILTVQDIKELRYAYVFCRELAMVPNRGEIEPESLPKNISLIPRSGTLLVKDNSSLSDEELDSEIEELERKLLLSTEDELSSGTAAK